MADVFISYARATAEVAQLIARTLRDEGYSVWVDDALPLHREFASVIEENLRAAKAVLVLWSAEARASRWVPAEADVAHERGTLVQLSLDGAPPPFPFNRLHCETAAGWSGDTNAPAWGKVRHSIAALVRSTRDEERPQGARLTTNRVVASERERLLAVLAFDNLSADAEMVDFCDGVSEEIQQTVAQGSGLKVVARSSSFQFRGADKAVDKVASALRATHLLDGSVRRSGSRVRISAQLVECEGGSTLWASRFDGDLEDVFALQDRIAQAVAKALEVTLSTTAEVAPLAPDIYELFLRARGMFTEGTRMFGDVAPEATPLLEQVVAAAPDYAPGWELLGLSHAWSLRSAMPGSGDEEKRSSALAAVDRALILDPKRGGAYVALSMLEPWGAYGAREKLLREALRVAPNDPGALTEMSSFYWSVGRFRDALAFAEKACDINPMMPSALLHMVELRYYIGDYRGSVRMHQDLVERWPKNAASLLSLLNCAASGGFWDAFDEAAKRISDFEEPQLRWLSAARTFAQGVRYRDKEFREKRLKNYTNLFDSVGFLPLNLVESLSQLGFGEEAMELALKSKYDVFNPLAPQPVGIYPGVIMSPWSALNKTPRFIELCDRLGLCAYWVENDHWPDCVAWTPYDFKAETRRIVGATA